MVRDLDGLVDGDELRIRDNWSRNPGVGGLWDLAQMYWDDEAYRKSGGQQGRPIGALNRHDLDLSLGQSVVRSFADDTLKVRREGDRLRASGYVDHYINDKYDFEAHKPLGLGGQYLRKWGGAMPFPIASRWRTYVNGTIDLTNDGRANPRFRILRSFSPHLDDGTDPFKR